MVTRNVILNTVHCRLAPSRCHSERQRRICYTQDVPVILSVSEESVPKAVRACAHKATILPEDICSSTFSICQCRRGKRPPWQRQMEDGRYAPVTLNIRSQWHYRGAYLHKNVEICAADPRYTLSTASSLCISPGMCAVKKLEPSITVGCLTDREQA